MPKTAHDIGFRAAFGREVEVGPRRKCGISLWSVYWPGHQYKRRTPLMVMRKHTHQERPPRLRNVGEPVFS